MNDDDVEKEEDHDVEEDDEKDDNVAEEYKVQSVEC